MRSVNYGYLYQKTRRKGRHVVCTDCHCLDLRQKVGRFYLWLRSRSEEKGKELDAWMLGRELSQFTGTNSPQTTACKVANNIDQVKQDPCFAGKIDRKIER